MSLADVLPTLVDAAVADVTLMSDADVRGDILDLVQAANLVQAVLASRMVCFDRRELAKADGFRSTAQWLAAFGRLSPHTAGATVKRGHLLAQLPAFAAAAARGVVSTEHVRKVADVAAAVGVEVVQQVDAVLADLASVATPEALEVACKRVRAYADPDGPEPDPEKVLQRRSLSFARVGDMVRVRGQLDPEAGAAVMTALDAIMTPPSADDARTATQRRADALTDLARLSLTTDILPITGGHRPQIGLLVTPDALLRSTGRHMERGRDGGTGDVSGDEEIGGAEDVPWDPLSAAGIPPAPDEGLLTWAGTISTATAQRLACDGIIYGVIYDPATGQPLDVGRDYRTLRCGSARRCTPGIAAAAGRAAPHQPRGRMHTPKRCGPKAE